MYLTGAEMSSGLKGDLGSRVSEAHTGLAGPGSQDPVGKEELRIRKRPE